MCKKGERKWNQCFSVVHIFPSDRLSAPTWGKNFTGRRRGMRKVIILALLLLATPVFGFERDHIAHFSSSTVYGLATGTVVYHYAGQMGPVERTLTSFGIALVPGIAWEIKDEFERDNRFGWDDLLADGIGALTGSLVAELVNGQFWLAASGKQIRLIGKW